MPSETARFTEVHAKDGSTVEHRRICPREDKEMPYEQIVNGFEASLARGEPAGVVMARSLWSGSLSFGLVTVLERRPD